MSQQPIDPIIVIEKDYPARRKIAPAIAFITFFALMIILTIASFLIVHKVSLSLGLLAPIIAELLTIWLFYKYAWGDTPIREGLYLRKITWKEALKGLSIGFSLLIISHIIFYVFQQMGLKVGSSETTKMLGESTGLEKIISLGILAPFCAPFVEELFFRGFICGTLYKSNIKENRRPLIAALVSAILFGFMHFQGFHTFLDFFILFWTGLVGYIHARLLMKHESVLIPFLSHLSYNGLITFILLAQSL